MLRTVCTLSNMPTQNKQTIAQNKTLGCKGNCVKSKTKGMEPGNLYSSVLRQVPLATIETFHYKIGETLSSIFLFSV